MTDDHTPDDEPGAPWPPSWSQTQQWLDDLDRDTATRHRHHRAQSCLPALDDDTSAEAAAVLLDDPGDAAQAGDPAPAADTDPAPADHRPGPVDDDPPTETNPEPRFNKTLAAGFAAATVAATVTVSATLLAMRAGPHTADEPTSPTTKVGVVATPTATASDTDHDTPIPYTASASCPPGSTAAQSVAANDPTHAWVCVRAGVDGQVLSLDLGRTMVITAISLTPGWVGADTSGADQWLAHRVLTRVQWIFNDSPPTVVAQHTGNVRGDAVQPMPHQGVLASKITMVVLETARAPADTATTAATATPGGLFSDILGPPAAPPAPAPSPIKGPEPPPALAGVPGDATLADPADNTFAVSSIKILGHPPQ